MDITELLSNTNALAIADYIITRFENGDIKTDPNKEIVDFEFDLSKDSGKMTSKSINTSYFLDAQDGDLLKTIVEYFFNDNENCSITKEDFDKLDAFQIKVAQILQNDFKERWRDAIRKRILGGAAKEIFPLPEIKVLSVEFENALIDFSLKVHKMSAIDRSGNFIKGQSGVAEDLINEYKKTKKPILTILAEKKASGDPRYIGVIGVTQKKEFYHCSVNMWVDYTAVKPNKKASIN